MSAKIISFATQKGGVGKSTLLMLTAAAIHNRTNKRLLVIDSDPQTSIKDIHRSENKDKERASYDVFAFNWYQPRPEMNFQKTVAICEEKYDVILIDVPGKIKGKEIYYSILMADIVIVPVVASLLDVNATFSFLHTLPEVRAEKEKRGFPLDVYAVVNKRDKSREHRHLEKTMEGIGGLKFFSSYLSNLVRYKREISTYHDITDPGKEDDEFNKYFEEFTRRCLD